MQIFTGCTLCDLINKAYKIPQEHHPICNHSKRFLTCKSLLSHTLNYGLPPILTSENNNSTSHIEIPLLDVLDKFATSNIQTGEIHSAFSQQETNPCMSENLVIKSHIKSPHSLIMCSPFRNQPNSRSKIQQGDAHDTRYM